MDDDRITLPRSIVAALVDPQGQPYIDGDAGYCNYCGRPFLGFPPSTPDLGEHAADCPVRLAQEELKEQP